ncbi:hypothetical protein TIFTF001_018624 [Ficus carica]|uniref:Uncharacterized protein n=1 Tax=Ficus carica TaxID=3494 RepID=A0AA88AA34_FICCA|nr:hypothetical protein TIFTF001_018624 [Ficus carica]
MMRSPPHRPRIRRPSRRGRQRRRWRWQRSVSESRRLRANDFSACEVSTSASNPSSTSGARGPREPPRTHMASSSWVTGRTDPSNSLAPQFESLVASIATPSENWEGKVVVGWLVE